jgi:L-rhamnose-H+ transport protein
MAAGIVQGAFMLPMKSTKKWAWENAWFGYSLTGYLIWPWLFLLFTIPHPVNVMASISMHSLVLVAVLGFGWGIGAITFGLGVSRLGMALGISVVVGMIVTAGTLIPMAVIAPEKLGQPQGLLTLASLALVLVGLALSSWGGKLRESAQNSTGDIPRRSFTVGLAICVASGLLSSFSNLGFAFGGEFVRNAIQQGAAESMAGNSVWAPLTLPVFICNALYCGWLMRKNKTDRLFLLEGTRHYWGLVALMGFMWMGGFVLYAPGTRRLGSLGTSVGWAIMMSAVAVTANILGFITGEWKGASRKARRLALAGVAILILAICVVGYANRF